MRVKSGFLLTLVCLLAACDTHVQEPWVQYPSYQQQERSRSAALNEQLEQRVHFQNDR